MDKLAGLEEAFKKAKIIFMTTYGEKKTSRQMTNYNVNPYSTIWFPTERDTKKVRDIEKNNAITLTFPGANRGEYYEIKGEASFALEDEVTAKWEWWWLYWHPAQKDRFWFPREHDKRRVIINVKPVEAKLVKK